MDYKRSFNVTFDAGVGRTGHRFRVQASTAVRYEPKTGQMTDDTLGERLNEVANELRNRSVNEMAPGVPATAAGLATYFMERLSLGHPRLYKVKVWETPDEFVSVVREIRQ